MARFHINRARFSWYFLNILILLTHCSTICFRAFPAAKIFIWNRKFGPHAHHQPFHIFLSHQQSININKLTKDSISAKQSLSFRIIIHLLRYCSIGILSNRMYNIFIVNQSYECIIQNVSTQFRSFHYHMHCLDRRPIDTFGLTFIPITFYLYILQWSNHCSKFLRHHHLYYIFVV